MTGALEKSKRLLDIASLQDGFFTSKQAKSVGYDTNGSAYHVKVGNWIREHRGIYRLASYPLPERPDLILWYLWSQDRQGIGQGVYSHATALSLYEVSDVNPAKLHMTVPLRFRKTTPIPKILHLHKGTIQGKDVRELFGVPVSSPIRTILDVVAEGALSRDILKQAISESSQRGIVTSFELEEASSLCSQLADLLREF